MSGERPVPVECARLAAELRELRERTGLSLAALGERTPYSKSSWERYLNGKKLPPRQAVDALCRLADEPSGRLLALWELAEQAWSGRSGSAPAAAGAERATGAPESAGEAEEPRDAADDSPWRAFARARRAYVLSGAAVVVVAVTVTLFLTGGWTASGDRQPDRLAATSPYPQTWEPACRDEQCEAANPTEMGCITETVTLLKRRTAGGQRLELRYNRTCGTVWGKGTALRLGDRVELLLPGSDTKEVKAASQRDTEMYLVTSMTATKEPYRARVCLRLADGGEPECFAPPASMSPSTRGG
ncbi:helix-turn-helix domain-containing protein [Streptomyces sp. NPDC053048]|uniref:helix-turn-helix domain-containing protein n=1 Tax=Streptomyces sp. NPDC053048 TaxID=3365694 RepID=UPI0037D66F16